MKLRKVDDITPYELAWAPLLWAMKLISRARQEKKIELEAPVFANLQSAFETVETRNRKLLSYGWVNFPLAYTQVRVANQVTYDYIMTKLCIDTLAITKTY